MTKTAICILSRLGSAKVLTREGPDGLMPEPNQILRWDIA